MVTAGSTVYVILRHRYRHLPTRLKKRKEYLYFDAKNIIQEDGHLDSADVQLYSSLGHIHE